MIVTLKIALPNHTWNIIISFKPYFIIIEIDINQTLVSHIHIKNKNSLHFFVFL